jgi:hypothetical protein
VNNGTLFYFTDFYGEKNSLLYRFYLGAQKVLLGYYDQLEINELLPLDGSYHGGWKIVQDFVSPFYLFLQSKYSATLASVDDINWPTQVLIKSEAITKGGPGMSDIKRFELELKRDTISQFTSFEKNKTWSASILA